MRQLLLLLFVFTSSLAFAQKYHIDGFIKDSFTKEKLDSVNVTLMSMDSTVVETFRGEPYGWWQVYRDIKAPGKYIMKFEHEGYYPAYKNVNFKYAKYRHTGDSFGEILMHKIRMKKEVTLKEVVVTATKVKMVMRGDTIVYDADAFQLSSGSMLDKLIRLLPGAQLEPGGEIYINGQKVESLLVNGENFFNGDPKVALDNLPHYMVDKIKVYRKMDERLMASADLHTLRKDQLPLVLDVNLKKEYTSSWVGNATVGYGTDHHHEARLFTMRFTPNSHIALVGNSNDVRGDSYYSSDGNWQEPYGNQGEITTHEVKIDGMLRDEDKKWKLSDQLSLKAQKRENYSKTSTTMFLGDDVYSRYLFNSTNKNIKLAFSGTNSYTPSRLFTLDFTPKVSYYHYDNRYTSVTADFNRQLTEHYMGEALDSLFGDNLESEYRKILISSLKSRYYGKGSELTTEGAVTSSCRFKDDRLSWSLSGYYNNKKNRSLNDYERVESASDMARFSDSPQRNYRYEGNIGYSYALDFPALRLFVFPQYGFKQSYASDSRWYHILDGSEASAWGLDQLYSNRDSISRHIDYSNSYRSQTWNKTNTFGLDFSIYFKREDYKNITLEPSIQFRNVYDRISYARAQTDTTIRRSRWLVDPSVSLRIDANTGSIGEKALDDISFTIPAGKTTAIVGESGSGKTTLMKLLLKFYKPTAGHITIGGHDLENISASSVRAASGVVMQENYIFSDTLKGNIVLGNEPDDHRVDEALDAACLRQFVDDHPLGLQTKLGSDGMGVSGGEKQRIMIARAIYKRPAYIMLDEATSSLDAETERKITENLGSLRKGRTMLVIAHRLSTVKNADNIIVLRHGKVVELGNHQQLVAQRGYYYELVRNQLELEES